MLANQNHPRLYIGEREISRIRSTYTIPFLVRAAESLAVNAEEYSKSGIFEYPQNTHNEHLLRARYLQNRIISLLVFWKRTDQDKYRNAVISHLREMSKWEYWSWITWRQGDPAPDAIWDLSYGENATTLAIAWDLLFQTLNGEEKELILGMVRKWVIPSFIKHTTPGSETWWVKAPKSNWLAVCASGGGLVALSMYEELPEAALLLERADSGITDFMNSLVSTGGGWTEGVAYWNYGMRYAFLYLLSYENAKKENHPTLALPETLETLRFPPVFSPHDKGCGFGDISDHLWQPVALHYAMAERLNAQDVLQSLDSKNYDTFENSWATGAELMALHPGKIAKGNTSQNKPTIKLYPGIFWGYFADSMPRPSLYVSVRGGSSDGGHSMADLLSWHCLVNGEKMVSSFTNHEYIDTTFSKRRFELPEVRPDTKNTIIIGGVGMLHPSEVKTTVAKIGGHHGFHMDATAAYAIIYHGNPVVFFVGRLFLFIESKYVLILDKILLKHTNRLETRLHTYANMKVQDSSATLESGKETANIVFASSVPNMVATSLVTPTNPAEKQLNVLRWATKSLHDDAVFATLLVPGLDQANIELTNSTEGISAKITINQKLYKIELNKELLEK